MSLLKITGKGVSPLKQLVNDITTVMREGGSEFASARHAEQICSLESLSPSELDSLNASASSIAETLRGTFEAIADNGNQLGFESLTPAQIEAGVIVSMAAGNPLAYAKSALTKVAKSSNGIPVVSAESAGVAGRLDYRDTYSMEAFDEKALGDMIPYSIAFNVQASRQDEFGETFYPTVVVSPDNGGLDIAVDRTTVFNAIKHQVSGKTTDFNRRNLVEAVSDATILADESTALVPFVQPGGENADVFVDPALVAPVMRRISDVDVATAPLVIGKEIDLLGISQHPQLIGAGVIDHTDAIDGRVHLNNLYMTLPDAVDPVANPPAVLKFNVSRLPRNGFNKSVEGQDREMTLNFRSEALVLNAATLAVDGTAPTALQAVRDLNYTVRLAVNVTGHVHTEMGTVQVMSAPISVVGIKDADGNDISMTAGQGLAIVQAVAELTTIGYELFASRTNSNRRTRGLLLTNVREVERFAIQLGAPISAPSPIGSDRDARDLDSLIAAARIRNSNNAVTTLLNYADTLRSYVQNRRLGHGVPSIEGVGRHVVVPFFEERDLDLTEALNSIRSKDRAEDVAATLINAIRDIAYRMYRDSAYQAALDSSSIGAKKPVLVVGTDTVLARHLMQNGDNRTFGLSFENAKVVTTLDSRMDNKIVITFAREGNAGVPDPLSFGCHAWIPELATSIMVARDGATYQEAMVQPRSRHINNLPVMAVINVTGLTDVMTEVTAQPPVAP